MGYMRHHAIIVASMNEEKIIAAHAKAAEFFYYVSPVSPPSFNSYRAFFVPPDGSKEGWKESDDGDLQRAAFIHWLTEQARKDGSTSLKFVEVQFADDNGETRVTDSSDKMLERLDNGDPCKHKSIITSWKDGVTYKSCAACRASL